MTVLHPCLHCHRKADCQIKRDTHLRLRGSGITKANLRCKIPEQDFPPGAIVSVEAFELRHGGYADDGYVRSTVHRLGVVKFWARGKAWVVLDKDQEIQKLDDENDRIGLLSVTTDRLKRIGEDLAQLCDCGLTVERCQNGDMPSIRSGKWGCPKIEPDWKEWI